MFLDDAALPSNPFTGKFPADGLSHRLRVEASGFASRTQLVIFDKDGSIEVALAPSASPSATPALPRLPGLAAPVGPATAAASAGPAAQTAAPTATAAPAAAKERRNLEDPWGADGNKPAAAPKRSLDAAEPWK
jgi:serine/threonine-protein kinase